MIQQRQIVIKTLGNQIDTEDPAFTKYAVASFLPIAWILISVNVTIYRTITLSKSYENSHYIIKTKHRSCI
jgi:hypothetical protein